MPAAVIFLHLQKTGGTSIRFVMRGVFGPKRLSEYSKRRSDGRWVPLTRQQITAAAWLGHMSFGLHTMLPEVPPYFTIVREPVQRELSRFRSIPQLRKSGLTPATAIDPEWGAVYQLSGIPLDQVDILGEEYVELALHNLQEYFSFVGDTSRMEEVGFWLKDVLHWPIRLPLPHENSSGTGVKVTEDEIVELQQHPQVKLDKLLYDRICELGSYPQEWKL